MIGLIIATVALAFAAITLMLYANRIYVTKSRTCENCKHLVVGGLGGECHRYPPLPNHSTKWPSVSKTDKCGEFKSR